MNKTELLILGHEGHRSKIYEDTRGNRTIGIGLNLENGISIDLSRVILKFQVTEIREQLKYKIPAFNSLSATRQDVLISVAFNLGISGLMKFKKMLAAIEEGNFKRASMELLDSSAARELHNRYNELAEMLKHG